ncbi:hypothetical protein [Candidatus Thiosymbion oneisti]|uniref:hypothetical protein n=1 Tax=Candidatus Thiosymbion oneisti TaxID=589554 RepID=UPI00105B8DBE|nr:hypothetical protein [Candidatus Thiosymbion oneisti]
MTQSLERAVKKARSLPEEEIEDEVRWDQAFANSQNMLAKLASEAMEEDRAGKTQELDLGRL